MPTKTNHRPAVLMALAASAGLTVLIIVGSRNLEHYDAALFGYTVTSVVAFGAVVFRHAIRPYFLCGKFVDTILRNHIPLKLHSPQDILSREHGTNV